MTPDEIAAVKAEHEPVRPYSDLNEWRCRSCELDDLDAEGCSVYRLVVEAKRLSNALASCSCWHHAILAIAPPDPDQRSAGV